MGCDGEELLNNVSWVEAKVHRGSGRIGKEESAIGQDEH